jgi:porin
MRLTLLSLALLASLPLRAQQPAPGAQPRNQPSPALYTMMTDAGFSFPEAYTGEFLGNPTGGHRQGVIYDGLLKLGFTLDLGKSLGWQGFNLTVNGLFPHGSSLTRNDVGDLNVLSNIDAVHSPRLYEAWVEKDSGDGIFSVRAGQVAIDTEFCVSTNANLFINSAFGMVPTVALNTAVAVYPVAAPGVRFKWAPTPSWTFMTGAYDGNVGNLHDVNRTGLRFNLNGRDGAIALAEADYTLNPPPPAPPDGKQTPDRPLSATFKLGAFYNTAHFPDNTTGIADQGDYGAYFIVDQELTHVKNAPGQGLRAFARLSAAPHDRNLIQFYCDGGFNYTGLIPGRPADILGLAASYAKLSDSYRDPAGNLYPRHYETLIELTYQAPVSSWLSLQPDLQYIFNPGGLQPAHDALVLGLRFNATF